MKTIKKPVKREAQFSAFRVGIDAKGAHRLEVRLPDQEWYADGHSFRALGELTKWLLVTMSMRLHDKGPYLEDAKHPGKPPCWHSGISRHLKLGARV